MRITQITDLHMREHLPGTAAIGRRRSREMGRLFPLALERIVTSAPDLIVVTGDLLDVPTWLYQPVPGFSGDDPAGWERAVEADYALVKRLLDATGIRYMVLPGNHDWDALMWRVFDPEAHALDQSGYHLIRFCDHEHGGNKPRRFNPERTRFEEALRRPGAAPQVHLQHYVLTPDLEEGYPHNYAESASLVRDITESGKVQICLSGHFHQGTELVERDGTYFTTAPAFCELPFRWRIYDLADGVVQMQEKQLDASSREKRPVVFLDRDGVINDRASYQTGPEEMHLLPGVARAIRRLRDAGYAVVVVTNQSCVGMGYVPAGVMHCVNDRMCRLLQEEADADVDAVYASTGARSRAVLPEHEDTSDCKPSSVLLERAREELDLVAGGWMVGDRLNDARTAHAAGARPILVRTGLGRDEEPAYLKAFPGAPVAENLSEAVDRILEDGQA